MADNQWSKFSTLSATLYGRRASGLQQHGYNRSSSPSLRKATFNRAITTAPSAWSATTARPARKTSLPKIRQHNRTQYSQLNNHVWPNISTSEKTSITCSHISRRSSTEYGTKHIGQPWQVQHQQEDHWHHKKVYTKIQWVHYWYSDLLENGFTDQSEIDGGVCSPQPSSAHL